MRNWCWTNWVPGAGVRVLANPAKRVGGTNLAWWRVDNRWDGRGGEGGLTGLAWGEYITHTRVEQERRRVDVFVTSPLISFLPSKSSAKGRSRSTDRERDHFSFFPSKSIKWLLIPKPLLTVISKSSSITSIPSLTSWIPSISSVRSSVIPKSSLSYITSISSSPSRTSLNGII